MGEQINIRELQNIIARRNVIKLARCSDYPLLVKYVDSWNLDENNDMTAYYSTGKTLHAHVPWYKWTELTREEADAEIAEHERKKNNK